MGGRGANGASNAANKWRGGIYRCDGEDRHGRAKMYGVGVNPKILRKEDCQRHEQMNEVVQRMVDEAQAKVRELEKSHECTKQELIAAHEQTKQELIASNDATAQELAATKKKLAATEANLETTNQKVESMSIDLNAIRAFKTSIQPLMGSVTQPSGFSCLFVAAEVWC